MKWASAVKSAPVKSDDCTIGARWAGSRTPPTRTGALESDGVGSPRQSKGASPTRSRAGSVGSSGCHASRETGADRSATRLHGMGVVPCTSTRGRGRVMLPSALTTARWQVGSGSCMRAILVREPGGSTAESPLTVNS